MKAFQYRRASASALVVVLISSLAGCGDDADDSLGTELPNGSAPVGSVVVNGVENEWNVSVDVDSVPAGQVTFDFANEGSTQHEMLVVKTDLAVGDLTVDPATGRFDEESDQWDVIDEIAEYPPGEQRQLTLTLDAGQYQLVCNIVGHYANGMATAFTVEE